MITATLKRTWQLIDAEAEGEFSLGYVSVPPGTYHLERVPCPLGHACNWLVLVDSAIGMSEGAWRDWRNGDLNDRGQPIDWKEFEIVIEETT